MHQYAATAREIFPPTSDQLQKVLSTIDIPACPAIVAQAMAQSRKDEPDLPRLAALIAADASLSAATLKLANSALYRSDRPISGVRQAVDRLGTRIVVCVVFSVALRSTAQGLPAAWLDTFWRRTAQLAATSMLVARRQSGISPDVSHTYVLFRDVAIPMMMKRFKGYEQVIAAEQKKGLTRVDAENSRFDCTHPIIGSLMARNWGLPTLLGQAIRFHHEDAVYELSEQSLPPGALSLIAVSQVAERLVTEVLGDGELDVGADLFEHALAFLGIAGDELDDLRHQVAPLLDDLPHG